MGNRFASARSLDLQKIDGVLHSQTIFLLLLGAWNKM